MQFSENLNLPLVEDSDPMGNLYEQGNGIVNGLETAIGGLIDDINDIPTIKTDIDNLETDLSLLGGRVTVLEQLSSKENVVINGVATQCTKHIAKLSVTTSGSSSGVYTFRSTEEESDDTHRIAIRSSYSMALINLTTAFGINNSEEIILKSVNTYQPEYKYMGVWNALPLQSVAVGNYPNVSGVQLVLKNQCVDMVRQTNVPTVGGANWQPSLSPTYDVDGEELIVVLEFYTFD